MIVKLGPALYKTCFLSLAFPLKVNLETLNFSWLQIVWDDTNCSDVLMSFSKNNYQSITENHVQIVLVSEQHRPNLRIPNH